MIDLNNEARVMNNDLETVEFVSDGFTNFEMNYPIHIPVVEIRKVVLSNKYLDIFRKDSGNEFRCSDEDLGKDYKVGCKSMLDYNQKKKENDLLDYSEDGVSYIVLVKLNGKEELNIETFDIIKSSERSIKFLSACYAKTKFKLMFLNNQNLEIVLGIVAQ